MKVRESGMPEADYWNTLFDVPLILQSMQIDGSVMLAVEFGCGFGTFAIPAARRIRGTLIGLDIEPAMIEATRHRAEVEGVENIQLRLCDFAAEGTGLDAGAVNYAMLFNILHAEDPLRLLREAYRILSPGGKVGVIHWNYDPKTPRGPPMPIRPKPENCRRWVEEAGFTVEHAHIDLPPHHYGILASRGEL